MDMKKILQVVDGANSKAEVQSSDMKKFLTIVEGKGPLNRPTVAETLTMQHYTEPNKTITSPVLNVAEGATPSMIGKYFKAVEQELREAAERPNIRATQLAKKVIAGMNEEWSQKYKSSINCSHPKGFSQKAHCAGKNKHNESIEMEMVCPDCGMCQTHGSLTEIAKGAKDSNGVTKCWPGKHAEGTKKGRNGGQVRNCVPNESQGVAEGLGKDIKRLATGKDVKSRAGQEIAKSQDASMKGDNKTSKKHFDRFDKLDKLANKEQGVAEGAPELLKKEMPTHRHAEKLLAQNGVSKDDPDYHHHLNNTIKHLRQFGNIDLINKSDEQGVAEAAKHGLYYNVNKRKKAGTSRPASSPKAPTAQAWKDAAKTAKKEGVSNKAANPAQQAAIAIAKKNAGKK